MADFPGVTLTLEQTLAAEQQTTLELIASVVVYPAGTVLTLSGFTTSGDGGGAQWKLNGVTGQTVSQSPAQLGDALLNDASGNQWAYIPIAGTAEAEINVKALGALGTGAGDDTDPINAAHVAGNPYLPRGTYPVTELVFDRNLRTASGAGPGATIIEGISATSNIVRLGKTGAKTTKTYLKNMTIQYDKVAGGGDKTSGAHLLIEEVEDCVISNVMTIQFWDGITIFGGKNITIDIATFFNGQRSIEGHRGLSIISNATAAELTIPTSIHLNNVDIESRNIGGFITATEGFYFNASDGIYMHACHVFTARYGLTLEPDTFFIGLWATNCYFDKAEEHNMRLLGSAPQYEDLIFTSCEFRAPVVNCVTAGNTTVIKGLFFNGCDFRQAGGTAAAFNSSGGFSNIKILGGSFKLNNTSAGLNIADVFYGATCDGITHNSVTHEDGDAASGRGVSIALGADNIVVVGNNMGLSNAVIKINDNSGAVTKVIANNI